MFIRNFVLCIQIRFVSTEKKLRASPRVHLVVSVECECVIMAVVIGDIQVGCWNK